MKLNQKIKIQRESLNLDESEVAEFIGMTTMSYCDIEAYSDELITVSELWEVKKLCIILKLDLVELLVLDSNFKSILAKRKGPADLFTPRNILILKRREKIGLSQAALGDKVGFHEIAIKELEEEENKIEFWGIDGIMDLSDVLKEPIESLILNRKKPQNS